MKALLYVAVLVAANLLVAKMGPTWSPVIAFFLIGLDLSLRDRIHEARGPVFGALLVVAAGALSFAVNPASGAIAVASLVAFVAAGLADGAVYQSLLHRSPLVKMNASNVAGALVDSIIFPTIAFGGLMPEIVALQFAAKLAGGALWAWILTRRTQ